MNTPAPTSAADLIAQFEALKDDIAFLRALRHLRIATTNGDVTLQWQEGSDNVALDLRSLTPNVGAVAGNPLPTQAGNAGKLLSTDGTNLLWE